MKHLLIGIMLCIAALGAKAESLYDACENIPGISTTYVSKVLLGAAQNQVYMYPQGMNLNHIVGKLDGIQVLEGEKKPQPPCATKHVPFSTKVATTSFCATATKARFPKSSSASSATAAANVWSTTTTLRTAANSIS